MIKGNHDRHSVDWYKDVGITLFKKPFVIDGPDVPIIFSHKQKPCIKKVIGINGHQHEKVPFIINRMENIHVNLSVEQINYTPIKFKNLMEIINIHGKLSYKYACRANKLHTYKI